MTNTTDLVGRLKSALSDIGQDGLVTIEQEDAQEVITALSRPNDAEKYHQIDWYERRVDVYCGDQHDQHGHPHWYGECEGDMDGDETDTIEMDAGNFVPGTRVLVFVPRCPDCDMSRELCNDGYGECDFDWKQWDEEKFS